jgi:hypothetical protein
MDTMKKDDILVTGDPNAILNLITVLDGYRIYRCASFDSIEKDIKNKKIKGAICNEWKSIKHALYKMAELPTSLPNVIMLMKAREFTTLISMIYISISLALVFADLMGLSLMPGGIGGYISLSAVFIMLLSFIVRITLNYRVALEINKYYKNHPKKFDRLKIRLKTIVQKLIDDLTIQVKHTNKKIEITLYNVDYHGIKIIKKPNLWRKYYVVVPQVRSKRTRD